MAEIQTQVNTAKSDIIANKLTLTRSTGTLDASGNATIAHGVSNLTAGGVLKSLTVTFAAGAARGVVPLTANASTVTYDDTNIAVVTGDVNNSGRLCEASILH